MSFGENSSFLVNHLIQQNKQSEFARQIISKLVYGEANNTKFNSELIFNMIENQYAQFVVKSLLTQSHKTIKLEMHMQVKKFISKIEQSSDLSSNQSKFIKFFKNYKVYK